MLMIPLAAVASQIVAVTLGGHAIGLAVYQRSTGLYLDVDLDGTAMLRGVLGRDRILMVRNAYFGFPGDLAWIDTAGTSDPVYDALGSRYDLLYLAPGDY